MFYDQTNAVLNTIKIIVLLSCSRYKLKLVSKCCVFKVRQYIRIEMQIVKLALDNIKH